MVECMTHKDIDVNTAKNMIYNASYPNLIVLDVRTQSEYNKGHLENAILMPVEELESRIEELSHYKDTEILVYCHIGARSSEVSRILDSQNFSKVYNVLNGITAWEAVNYPIIAESQ